MENEILNLKEIYLVYGDQEVWISYFIGNDEEPDNNSFLKPTKVKVKKRKKYIFLNEYYVDEKPNIKENIDYIVSVNYEDVKYAYIEEVNIWYNRIITRLRDRQINNINTIIDAFCKIK